MRRHDNAIVRAGGGIGSALKRLMLLGKEKRKRYKWMWSG